MSAFTFFKTAAGTGFKTSGRKAGSSLLAASLALMLGACATPPPADDPEAVQAYREINDPLEPMNRAFFEFNRGLDKVILRPVAEIYRNTLPDPVRDAVRNFLDNLGLPLVFANDILQGEFDRAGQTFGRFTANTFIGVGGLFNVVPDLEKHDEDFGQTLAVWGLPSGPYLVLPLIGPTSPRDVTGRVAEYFADPVNNWSRNTDRDAIPIVRTAVDTVDFRSRHIEEMDEIERNAIDFYATVRSLYRQHLEDQIRNGGPRQTSGAPEMSFDFDEDQERDKLSALAAQ